MSRNTKIILGVLAGVLVLTCLCAASVAAGIALFTARTTSVSVNPERVEQAAARVGVPPVPEGWRTDYTVRVGDIQVTGYRPQSGNGHMVFAMLGPEMRVDVEKLGEDIHAMTGGRYTWFDDEMTVVERRTVLLGDQEAEVIISEGQGSSGPWRQAITTYQNGQGFTVAMLGLPASDWSEQTLDEFIHSLR